jgi:hypothetical protein
VASIPFFIAACVLGGLGGALGSMVGAAFGQRGLFIGGFLGGLTMAFGFARVAVWRNWIGKHQFWATAVGTAVGFLAAATVAVNTLSTPIGPILSTSLTGLGALAARRMSR